MNVLASYMKLLDLEWDLEQSESYHVFLVKDTLTLKGNLQYLDEVLLTQRQVPDDHLLAAWFFQGRPPLSVQREAHKVQVEQCYIGNLRDDKGKAKLRAKQLRAESLTGPEIVQTLLEEGYTWGETGDALRSAGFICRLGRDEDHSMPSTPTIEVSTKAYPWLLRWLNVLYQPPLTRILWLLPKEKVFTLGVPEYPVTRMVVESSVVR